MHRREFPKGSLAAAAAAGSASWCARAAEAPPAGQLAKTNVVLVMCDDMGWGDLAANGSNKVVRTPHLNAMAAVSLRCTRFYASSPLCSPTRAAFLTG